MLSASIAWVNVCSCGWKRISQNTLYRHVNNAQMSVFLSVNNTALFVTPFPSHWHTEQEVIGGVRNMSKKLWKSGG